MQKTREKKAIPKTDPEWRYEKLDAWLVEHRATLLWEVHQGTSNKGPRSYLRCFVFPSGRVAVVQVHANQMGWEIFTCYDGNDIIATLADAETRLRLGGR